jgi:hypothetical protein
MLFCLVRFASLFANEAGQVADQWVFSGLGLLELNQVLFDLCQLLVDSEIRINFVLGSASFKHFFFLRLFR